MMTTIQEKRILEALAKASNIGLVEESVTVMGCRVVLRNLRPEEYQDVSKETDGMLDAEFLFAYQMGHICRSVVEIGDIDLRAVDYIETDLPDKDNPGKTKKVSLERHEWVRRVVLATWGREALSTLYRKFADVLQKADDLSIDGVQFVVPDETAEDKLRRVVSEMHAIEEDLPDDLVTKVLGEHGYARKTSEQEMDKVSARLAQVAQEKQQEPVAIPAPTPDPVLAPTATPAELMRRRIPLTAESNQEAASVVPAAPIQPQIEVPAAIMSRAQHIAELEKSAIDMVPQDLPEKPKAIAELSKQQERLNPAEVMKVLDKPPMAGINPRFRPPTAR